MKMKPTVTKCKNMKKQGIQRMRLFTVEYYADVKCFFFSISNHHQGNINM